MKVGLLYPCVAALVEKMATLFPGLTVIGPPCDQLYSWDKKILNLAKAKDRIAEWNEVGLDLHFEEKPYSECDFSKFDLLIESVETFNYSADWKNHCHRVECPILVFVCWYDSPDYCPPNYIESVKNFPVFLGMPSALNAWNVLPDVTSVAVPVGDWWFDREWTGKREEALFVLAGKDIWRPADKTVCGVDLWERLCERFPGRMHHHDGATDFKTSKEMADMMSEYRVFVNLDRSGARPLCTSFTEAICAGMPVVARDQPGLSYKNYIGSNGICTDDFKKMCAFISFCLDDLEFARYHSIESRRIGRKEFSTSAVRPHYDAAYLRAKEAFRCR
jgi:glycosyltransferase involved in cell wall biosynthesis